MIPIGIDLGTTNSLIAVFRGQAPELIPNRLGEVLTPSAVFLSPSGEIEVGATAKVLAGIEPERGALNFKLDMGTEVIRTLGDRRFSPVELSALVLRSLREDAERYLGQPVTAAAITVPAYFDESRRAATKDAAKIAGLEVLRILNEPTAAAIAYGQHALPEHHRLVVMDLGGGTFDVSVLEIEDGVVEIQASAGDIRLGGEDFTKAVAQLLAEKSGTTTGDRTIEARRTEAAERAKRGLGEAQSIDVTWPGFAAEVHLERQEVEAAYGLLLAKMETVTKTALFRANRNVEQIDQVLLVGGATRMPCVRSLAEKIFDKPPLLSLHPDQAIALGAAVQAALVLDHAALSDLVVTDIAPYSLGIATSSSFGSRKIDGLFSVIIERGTVLPASRVQRFSTINDHQRQILIQIYQGDHAHCADNVKIGEYALNRLPPKRAGEVSVDVRFTYDLSGLVDVDLRVVGTEVHHALTIDRSGGALSPEKIEALRKSLARLKVHPEETLPNRHARAMADAAFVELSGEPRQVLAGLIADFEGALATQDPNLITEQREILLAAVAQLGLR